MQTKLERQAAARERQAARDARGDAAQLARLEAAGHGHCKEAQRLRKKLTQGARRPHQTKEGKS